MDHEIKVLLVEDEEDYLETLRLYLERNLPEFVETSTFDHPNDALEHLADSEVDVIVSDFDMPEMDGLELYEEVKEQTRTDDWEMSKEQVPEEILEQIPEYALENVLEETSHLPFILHTGKGSEELAGEAIDAGVDGYVQKSEENPFQKLSGKIMEHGIQSIIERKYERLRPLGESILNSKIPLIVFDEETDIHFANDALLDNLGYELDELLGEKLSKINDIPEEEYPEISETIEDDHLWTQEGVRFFPKRDEVTYTAEKYLIVSVSDYEEEFRVAIAYGFQEDET